MRLHVNSRLAVKHMKGLMSSSFIVLFVSILIFAGCGKNFTPATQKDVENASQSAMQKQTCINENIILTFSPTEATSGQVTVEGQLKVYSTENNNLVHKILEFENLQKQSTKWNSSTWSISHMKPTILGRNRYGITDENRNFVKFICAQAKSVSLQNYSVEYAHKLDRTNVFDSRHDTVHEVWACNGPCN